ncbi:MAG: hypothetical protein ACI3X9_10370, partial [Bacteroidaceae bacterium]
AFFPVGQQKGFGSGKKSDNSLPYSCLFQDKRQGFHAIIERIIAHPEITKDYYKKAYPNKRFLSKTAYQSKRLSPKNAY